ncbi:MAG: class I SAM-dependent RNA methyltransferase [Acidobacteria bacterium]|nr:class I SAM-dependent RNA methyltransferase [Acidobacteriota bacterium]
MRDQRVTLTIERPVAGGRMLARHDGRVVLVSGAIPGETVVARVESVSKKVILAATVDVVEASPDRRVPHCDSACGGSVYAHIGLDRQRVIKAEVVADAFRRIGRLPLEAPVAVAASPERGYRLRGRLHVQRRRAGFFLERSHRLCDARATAQFRDDTMAVVERLIDWLGDAADACESIVVGENVTASDRVLHLEPVEGRDLSHLTGRAVAIEGLTGVTTVSRGRMVLVAGEGRVTDTALDLCGEAGWLPGAVTWTRTAASFFQGNRFLTGALLQQVLRHVRGRRVLDLYAGVGLFSVGLAARGAEVLAVEGDEVSVTDLELNASRWGTRLTTRQAAVEATLVTLPPGRCDTVVLDPPRTGASPEAVAGVIALGAGRVVYVSCDPATLARDAALLVPGGYRLASIEAFDLFPNTPHVETLAVFDRVSG